MGKDGFSHIYSRAVEELDIKLATIKATTFATTTIHKKTTLTSFFTTTMEILSG
jgi:hypothetical protein